MLTSKLQRAKEFLGDKYVFHPNYKAKRPDNSCQSRVLRDVILKAQKAKRI